MCGVATGFVSMSLVDLQWCPTSVQVTVQQARGLRIKGKSGTNDAYAVMQVGKEKFQTSVVEKSVAPVWKEEAAFDLPPLLHQSGRGGTERCTLHVHVLHRALVGPDKLLGQAVINLLQLSEDKTRIKTEWFKLLDKTGKADKDRGEVLVDIQFMRNNMTASMFDLSAAGKSRSRLGKFKDKVRGKKKESDTASNVVPSFSQVLTDSEEEGNGEVAAGKDEKKKKHKMKSLFSSKSNLQRNMSQSMSILPAKNSSLSGSQSSGLNVDSSEGKKKFKFMMHKRSGSSGNKDSSSDHQKLAAAEQNNLCINGSHVYREEPQPRTSRIGSNFSLTSSGHESMEDVPKSSPPSVDSLRAVRQYSPWTEEEEEEVDNLKEDVGEQREEDERIRKRREEEKRSEEKVRKEEEERIRREVEERRRQEEEESVRREEELERLAEEKRLREQERRIEEKVRKEEEDRIRREEEEERVQEERRKQDEEERERLAEENKRLQEQEVRKEEDDRIRMEEERAQEERREEEERAMKREEERIKEETLKKEEEEGIRREKKIAEEERRREEEEQREEEDRIRMEEERAQEEGVRRQEERILAEEKGRLEEEERIEEETFRKERIWMEEEKERAEKERRQEEMVRRQEEEEGRRRREEEDRIRKGEEEMARRGKEEYERLVEEQMRLEEEERKRIEAEEEIKREEEERIRVEEEMMMRRKEEEREQLAEEKRKLEEQERRRIQEEEKSQREEEDRIREEEEEKARKEKEEYEKLVEEKIRQERRWIEEERIMREAKAEKKRKEDQAMKLEKEKLTSEAEERNQTKPKAAGKKPKVPVESPAEVTSNPFDENFSNNDFGEIPDSPAGPDSSTAKASSIQQRDQSAASSLGSKTVSTDDKDPIGTQRERRLAPQPPGINQSERPEQDGSTQHLAQMNKKSKDQDLQTVSVLPQRSVQMIAPLSRSSQDTKNTQSLTQSSGTKETSNLAKHGKRPAPSKPRSEAERLSSDPKTTPPSDGNMSHECISKAKQTPTVYGLNPFDDDDDDAAQDDGATSGPTASVQWPPVVSHTADKYAAFQTKIKSSKARAPLLPAKEAATSSTSINQNTEGDHVTGVTDNSGTHTCDPESEAISPEHVQEAPPRGSQPVMVQSAGEEAGGKKEGPPVTLRRLQPVKPLNPLEQQSVSIFQGEKDKKSSGIFCEDQDKTKVNVTGLKGPYSELTREELISLVLKQENQLSDRNKKISDLEQYIDNLLVRIIEEKPSILMSLNSLKKPV
ncbi:trichohyalin-like [Cottoperca gobio]|uniref:Trichohyalin-like n=1 Tax=Cottoperca gobio TaxID=56716 RepID=A0A6J2QVV6_COTGO|nr:trichohyalin-like [Cottoperca gobio]